MKKLLDETTDDLTRALLEAGRSHRPPPGNQARVLLAMGAGAGVGLFSSKAFAWLSTSAGKLTLLGVTLGIAGAVVVALPPGDAVSRDAVPSEARGPLAAVDPAVVAPQVATGAAAQPNEAQPLEQPLAQNSITVPAPVAGASSELRVSSATSSRDTTSVSARREHAPASSVWQRRTSAARKRPATRRDDVSQPLVTQADGPLPAASASPPAVGAPVADPAGAVEAPEERVSGLESEIQLVDAMRGAAQRNDTSALRRLVASYRGAFPAGQLRQEVSELALRALPAAH